MSKTVLNAGHLCSLKDVAKLLGISQNALRIRVSKGTFPQPNSRKGSELFWDREVLRDITGNQEDRDGKKPVTEPFDEDAFF